jgi:SAM-dependent methyltransferase
MAKTKSNGLTLLSQDFLSERLVPELEVDTVQYFDHIRRYQLAQQYVVGRRVLDIACGTGYGSDILRRAGAKVFSIDMDLAALHYAARRWAVSHPIQADAAQIPLPAHSMDVVVSLETIEHLPDPAVFLAEIRRILIPGGYLVLSTPNRLVASPGSARPFSPYHTFEPSREELLSLLSDWRVLNLHGITHSSRAHSRPVNAPYQRKPGKIAWTAYLRLWVRRLLPPIAYDGLRRLRNVPDVKITDSILRQAASDEDANFVAVCTS